MIRPALLFLALAAPAHAATDLDPCLHIARPADPAGAAQWAAWWHGLGCLIPANAGTWAPKAARVVRPKPRPCVPLPVCLLPEMPQAFRWEPVRLRTDQMAIKQTQPAPTISVASAEWVPPLVVSGGGPRWHEAPLPPAGHPRPPIAAIPLPASWLLLLSALALLWISRR